MSSLRSSIMSKHRLPRLMSVLFSVYLKVARSEYCGGACAPDAARSGFGVDGANVGDCGLLFPLGALVSMKSFPKGDMAVEVEERGSVTSGLHAFSGLEV